LTLPRGITFRHPLHQCFFVLLLVIVVGMLHLYPANFVHSFGWEGNSGWVWEGEAVHVQENSDLLDGAGIKRHWNLTEAISSTASAFDAVTYDVDDDGQLEIIVSKNAHCEFYCLEGDGTVVWQTPVLSTHPPGYYGGQVIDLDGDGVLEYIAAADAIWVRDAHSGAERWTVADVGAYPQEAPWVLGRVSSASSWDVIIGRAHEDRFVISVYDAGGEFVWSYPIEDAIYGHTLSVQDVDADGRDEVFVACSKRTVALDDDGSFLWSATLASNGKVLTPRFVARHDLPHALSSSEVEDWWYHSDFVTVADLYGIGRFYALHDYGGGVLDPTTIQVLDALTGVVVDEFQSSGHIQWLIVEDLIPQSAGQEIVYVTREQVVLRDSSLEVLWEKPLSGAHHLGTGDWDGDGSPEIIVSTIFRGLDRFAGADSNFVVYSSSGDILYNMLFEYPEATGHYAGVEMQSAMRGLTDSDGDGRVDVTVSFSNHDVGKFDSSQDVHHYVLSSTSTNYHNEFLHWGNESTFALDRTLSSDNVLQLSYLTPTQEYICAGHEVLLLHLNEGSGAVVSDSSSWGHQGRLQNTAWVSEGRFGSALRFEQPGATISISHAESLDLEYLTIDAWVKVSPSSLTQSIVEKYGSYGLRITPDGELWFFIWDMNATRGKMPEVKAPFTGFDNFSHVVAIYDGKMLRLIVDGEQVATEGHVGSINNFEEGITIGNKRDGTMPLQGVLDEIRISSSAQLLPRQLTGTWVSKPIFPPTASEQFGVLYFDQSLYSGQVSYSLLNMNGHPLPGHENIINSPHSVEGITEPVRLQISLKRGHVVSSTPVVDSVAFSWEIPLYFPFVIR
jgi:hypothetical protein